MTDIILEKFFEMPRWEYAIDKGVGKDISRRDLCQLAKPEIRARMYQAIKDGKYEIAPPHTAQIPKDNGEFRTVYVNEPMDRILLSIANDLLFELTPEMIHSRCKSYQKEPAAVRLFKKYQRKFVKLKVRLSAGNQILVNTSTVFLFGLLMVRLIWWNKNMGILH